MPRRFGIPSTPQNMVWDTSTAARHTDGLNDVPDAAAVEKTIAHAPPAPLWDKAGSAGGGLSND